MIVRPEREIWLIAMIALLIMFFNLGGVPLLDPDEPVYAETSLEMLAFQDFVSPRIFGEYWYDKPPLYYWLVAGAFKLFGVGEFAARFPSALLAVAGVLFVYRSGSRLFNHRAGLAGSLVLATSLEYFYLGKAAVTDITLTFCLTVALLSFLEKRYYLFYFFTGLAVVAKGPVGFLFPGAILFFYMIATRNFALLRTMKLPTGILLFLLVALPWYVAMYYIHGSVFLDTFIGFNNITRFTSPEHPEGVLWYYFIPVLLIGFFPWTAILAQAVWSSLADSYRREFDSMVFLNIWVAFTFVFFSISQTKLVSYILPLFPPLALIAGWYVSRFAESRFSSRLFAWPILLTLLTGMWLAGMFFGLQAMPELLYGIWAAAGVFCFMLAVVWYSCLQRQPGQAFWVQVGCMAVFSAILVSLLLPPVAYRLHSRTISQDFVALYDGVSPVYVVKFLRPGFAFYSRTYGEIIISGEDLNEKIDTTSKAYFVVRRSEYKGLSEARRGMVTVAAEADDKLLLLKQ
jgi:4-amino-4-deoxy-L-arabinose transferase-like glycosyltransferase